MGITNSTETIPNAWFPRQVLLLGDFRYRCHQYDLPVDLEKINEREDVCLLDVRPKDEYEKGHIPNTLSVPVDELNDRLNEIPKDKRVIAYCRGMFCSFADEAVKILHPKGFKARKIEENFIDYQILMDL